MSSEGEFYTVNQGDSVSKLSFQRGLALKTIWEHPKNKQLKDLRKTPNVLKEGDELFIPARSLRHEQGPTEARHKFKRKGVPEKLQVQFFDYDGKPLAGTPYELTIDGKFMKGKLDGQGWLKVAIAPDAATAKIVIGEKGEVVTYQIKVGHLDPISELSGVQARLRHLGYYDGLVDGVVSELFRHAVGRFKEEEGLTSGSEIDDEFRERLKERHFS